MENRKRNLISILLLLTALAITLYMVSCDLKLTDPDLTNAPSNLKLKKVEEGRIEISWTYQIPEHNDSDTLYFVIGRKVGTGNWNDNYQNISTLFFTYVDNIPTNDSLVYAYKVKFYNKSMDESSPYSEIIAYLSNYCDPTNIQIEQISQAQVQVSWKDHCVGEEGFYIDKKIGNGNWTSKYRTLGANVTSFIDDINLFEEVYYRVSAFVGTTTTGSVENSIIPTYLPPSNLVLSKPDNNKIRLNWQDNSAGETGFHIDKKIGGSDWIEHYATVDSNIVTFIDNVTEPCGTFSYRVKAYSGTHTSGNSNEESINILLDLIGEVSTPGVAQDIMTSGWYAFVSDNYAGLQIIDYSNPESPDIVYTMDTFDDRVLSVDIEDNFAYVTSHSGTVSPGLITTVDISNPLNPQPSGSSSTSGIPYDIEVIGDFAYIADGDNGLTVFFIANSTPDFVVNVATGGHAQRIFVNGNYAYIAQGLNGIAIYDITDPYNPTLESTYLTTGAKDIFVNNNNLYIADSEDGLLIIDVSTPSNPVLVTSVHTNGFAFGVTGQDDYVYIADSEIGLIVADVTTTPSSYILGSYKMDTAPNALVFSSSYTLSIDNEGMKIIQVEP
ncbi:MAG TPA: hypothetical protein ENG70_06045 [Candidatus Cloacimonetes bacterium]|nr:hypothetical protein [Candidatus Cloacimonadota bacterium]HEX38393.1 hypothetical protein [Candidatus Cloacimonadota bacterium]